MKNLLKLSAVAMTVVAASAAPKFAASFNAGTAGVGAGLDFKAAKNFTVGANVDYFGLAFNTKKSNLKDGEKFAYIDEKDGSVKYDKDIKDKKVVKEKITSTDIKVGINAKYHPFSNGFFVGAGVNMHKASAKATYSSDVELKDENAKKTYTKSLEDGELKPVKLSATRFTPSVNLGYKANVAENIALGLEAGVEYIGTWKEAKDGEKAKGSKLALLAKNGAFPLSKSLAKSGFLPSVKVGVSYAF